MTDLVEVGKAKAAGIVSILIGITALMDLVCGFLFTGMGGFDGSEIWTGLGLAICAGFGLITWWKRSKIAMVFFLVLDILWFVVCVAGVIFTLLMWLIYHVIRRVVEESCQMTGASCQCNGEADKSVKTGNCDDVRIIESCLLGIQGIMVLNGLGAVFVLAGSIIGCMGTCCANQTHTNVVVLEQPGMAMQTTGPVVPPPVYPTTSGEQ